MPATCGPRGGRCISLADQKIAGSEDQRACLHRLALDCNEPHGRAHRRLADRLSIGRIVLLALDEGLNVFGRNQLDLMAELDELAAPMVSPAAGLHHHRGRRL